MVIKGNKMQTTHYKHTLTILVSQLQERANMEIKLSINKKQQQLLSELVEKGIEYLKELENDTTLSVNDRNAVKSDRIELELIKEKL